MSRLTTLLCLFACASVVASSANAAHAQYVIERSLDDGASWTQRGTVVVTGATVNAAKAKFTAGEESAAALSTEQRKELLASERIFYRVRDASASSAEIARIVTTPCTIVRGFTMKNTKEAELLESLNVVVTKGADNQNKVTGLQIVPRANLHHTSTSKYATAGSECDKDILDLFPTLTVGTTVGVSRATVAKRTPKVDESMYFAGQAELQKEQQQQQQQQQKRNEEGKAVDDEGKVIPEPDNRSFIEKYWHYMLMFVAWQFLQTYLNPQKKGGAEGAAAGAAAAPAAKK